MMSHSEPNEYMVKFSRRCYYVCLGGAVLFAALRIVMLIFDLEFSDFNRLDGCMFYGATGLYCPGCGGTRAVNNLLSGHIVRSLIYHPVVLYTAVLGGCYIASHTLNIVTKGKVKAMLFRPIYLFLMLGIIILNWLIKNALILFFGIYVLG